MRKLLIGIGLLTTVIGSTYVYTQASSYSYHQATRYNASCNCNQPQHFVDPKQRYTSQGGTCCTAAKRAKRPFSDRIGVYKYRRPSAQAVARYGYDISHPSRRHDVWYHSQYRKADPTLSVAQRKELTRRYQGYGGANARSENTTISPRHVIRNGQYKYKKGYPYNYAYFNNGGVGVSGFGNAYNGQPTRDYTAYQNTGMPFGVDLQGMNIIQTGENTFSDKNSSLVFRIVRSDSCDNTFQQCARTLSKAFKQSQNLGGTQNIYARQEAETTVEFDGTQYPTFQEGFIANGYGTNNGYFTYTMLDPSNGSVVRIEAVALQQDMSRAAKTIHDVYNTFLFKPAPVRAVFLD